MNRLSVNTLSSLHVRSPQGSELAGAEIPRSYFVANIKLGYSLFSSRVQIYTDILNITDTNYQEILGAPMPGRWVKRSEEHTSELQSRGHLVCRLLLEKKKKQKR